MKQDFDAYKSRYKVSIRNKIPGLQLGELTINGVAYSKVKVNDMGEVSLKFSHYAGMSTVLLKDLPTEVKDLLALTALHDPLPLRVVVSKVKPKEMDLMSTHKSRQREVDEQLAELRNNMLAAEKESAYAKHLVQASIGKNKTPHPKAVDYAREAELRYHQLVAKEALLEVEKDQLYALYQAELRKLRVSR